MRHTAFLLGIIVLFAASARAQENSAISFGPPASEFALNAPITLTPTANALILPSKPEANALAAAGPAPAPQDVQGVFHKYSWQLNAGYTFVRFYEVPGKTLTMNGFNLGASYFYRGGWVGADGQLLALFGSQLGRSSHLDLAMGGPRFRWSGPRGVELWGHGLVGIAHETPRTAYGDRAAFAYEVGGGIDVNTHSRRFAYRAEADMVGTRFFHTYQYSPQVSVGLVFKF